VYKLFDSSTRVSASGFRVPWFFVLHLAVKLFGSHTGEGVVDVYTPELVDSSGMYAVPLENKFTVHIIWSLPWKKGSGSSKKKMERTGSS